MAYELWDSESGNCIGAYSSEESALAQVARVIELRNSRLAASLLLGNESDGRGTLIARGEDLIARAKRLLCEYCGEAKATEHDARTCPCGGEYDHGAY